MSPIPMPGGSMSRSGNKRPIVRFSTPSPEATPRRWTVRLGAVTDRDLVGGKARGLGKVLNAGFDVPRGFCVTTDAFQAFVGALATRCDSIDQLQQAIESEPLPEQLIDEIRAGLDDIDATSWAVRSSAVAEDTETRSYAGQALSVLDVTSHDDVIDAVRRVWSSHFSMDRLLYLARGNVEVTPSPAAVLIQEMLDPVVAGVLFTVNPLTGDDTEAVVTSAPGLGEAVVSGRRGDTFYLDKRSGYVRRHVSDEEEDNDQLGEHRLKQLASVARGVETTLSGARDIEWAYAFPPHQPHQPTLYLLQARPITSEPSEQPEESVWTNANVGEALPGVATPMTWSIIRDFSRRGFEQAFGVLGLDVPQDYELVESFQGRIYLNLTQFMSIASGQPLFKPERLFSMAGGGGVEMVRDIYERRSKAGFLRRLPFTIPRILASQLSMPLIAPLWGEYFTKKVDEFFDRDLTRLQHHQLQKELRRLDQLFDRTGMVMLSTSSNFLMSYVVTAELLRLLGGQEAEGREQQLVSGLDVKSAEPGLELLQLGRRARRSLRLRRIITDNDPEDVLDALLEANEHDDVAQFLNALDQFRNRHGHRAPREAELATPRWREDMSFLFEVVRSFIESPNLPSSTEVERERKRKKEAARQLLNRMLPGGLDVIIRAVLAFTRSNARRREYMRDRVVDSLDIYRRFFLECGSRLTRQGQLRHRDDVFFLTRTEIEAWLDNPRAADAFPLRVLTRKALHAHFDAQPDPPDTFLLRGTEVIGGDDAPRRIDESESDDEGADLMIEGLPGSSGRVSGPARVIFDPRDSETAIQPGEILVAPYTDVGWTPLFLTASGVVMSLGGPLSHSCIVAREYDIPTVVNAKMATELIETGDWVTVDGDEGIVYVRHDGPSEDA